MDSTIKAPAQTQNTVAGDGNVVGSVVGRDLVMGDQIVNVAAPVLGVSALHQLPPPGSASCTRSRQSFCSTFACTRARESGGWRGP
jgi:hypothetical protein